MRIRTTPLAGACAVVCFAAANGAAQAPAESPERLSLAGAVARVLAHHPSLLAATREVEARARDVAQAAARPNPHLSLEVENAAGSGPFEGLEGSEATISLAQRLEIGGQRGRRVRAAATERDLAAADRDLLRVELSAAACRAYATLWVAQRRADVASELQRVSEDLERAAAARVQAGAASTVERRRASVALESARIGRERAEQEAAAAALRLASLWGEGGVDAIDLAADLTRPAPVPELDGLLRRAEAGARIARVDVEIARRRADAEATRGVRVPDLELTAGFRRFDASDDHALLFGVSLPLPLFDRRAAAIDGAARRVAAAERARDAEALRVRTEVAAAYRALATSFAEIEATRDRVLPEADAAFAETREAYLRGRLGLTDVLDAERTLFELKDSLYASIERHHVAAAELSALLGEPASEEGR